MVWTAPIKLNIYQNRTAYGKWVHTILREKSTKSRAGKNVTPSINGMESGLYASLLEKEKSAYNVFDSYITFS